MKHLHYYQVKAQTYFELGDKLAKLFKAPSLEIYHSIFKKIPLNETLLKESQNCLKITEETFPNYIEEIRGYASGLGVDFDSFWLTFLTEELDIYPEKCTSCFSSDGMIVGHNEDNFPYFTGTISIVEKMLGNMSIFELYYYNSIGGSACSVNSNGYIQTINTLHHTDKQIGIPRNIISRWLSETNSPKKDFEKLNDLKRTMGYSHTFCSRTGHIFNIESSARESRLIESDSPFIHTNHFLTDLSKFEDQSSLGNTMGRYNLATSKISQVKTAQDMINLMETISLTYPNDTIARMVIDIKNKTAWCWLARESSSGWIQYPLSFL
jgi:hypothetical protein